jgi:integrase
LKASEESQTKSQGRRTIPRTTATARRGHGEGSVYRDAAKGTWVGAVEEIARLAGHASSRATETIYRHELRPVITTGADVMDKIFTAAPRER